MSVRHSVIWGHADKSSLLCLQPGCADNQGAHSWVVSIHCDQVEFRTGRLMLQVILTVRDEEKWYQSVRDVIVRLYRYMLQPFFWHTRLGRQYTAIIGWGLQFMFHGERPLVSLLYTAGQL